MTAYYNEFHKGKASWLRELIKMGCIADGEVDERDFREIKPDDLKGFTQHHFFAGIGVWSYALRKAGWADDRPVVTASLPCQSFSVAGKQKGKNDERHLLPNFLDLVKECGFNTIFGEQVEAAIKHGWLDDLQAGLEAESYALGHCILGAHSINAAHIRQRLFWVGDTECRPAERFGHEVASSTRGMQEAAREQRVWVDTGDDGSRSIDWLYCQDNKYRPIKSGITPLVDGLTRGVVYSGGQFNPNATAYARKLRIEGYGDAINADVAAEFIGAYMEITA